MPLKAQTVQYVTLVTSGDSYSETNLLIQTNQIVTLIGNNTNLYNIYGFPSSVSGPTFTLTGVGTYTGLNRIEIQQGGATLAYAVATFKIETPATATVVSNYVPADAIVIPSSATGNVQIILESSPDLVNWTAASPGTYGAAAGTNRFFRVRAVAQ